MVPIEQACPSSRPRKYDPTFKGPIHNRGCTDIICCILFILALLGYFAVGILAWSQGDPRKVIYPTDSRGQFCGQAGTPLENKPNLFYFNIMKCASPLVLLEFQCPTPQICVEKCPDRFLTLLNAFKTADLKYYKSYCKEGSAPEVLKTGLCPAMILPSKPLSRRCFPAFSKKNGVLVVGNQTTFDDGQGKIRNAKDLLEGAGHYGITIFREARQLAMKIFEDYTHSWYWILIGLVIAMVISLIFIILLRFLAGIMVWVMIILVILVIGYGMVPLLAFLLISSNTTFPSVIILCIVEVIIILLLIFLRKRILIAIALIKEASRAIGYVMSSLFYPLLTFILLALVIAYWAVTAIFLSTSNEPVYKVFNDTACEYSRNTCKPETFNTSAAKLACPDAKCLFAFYGGESPYHKYLIAFQFYNVFLFFWCANFVTALGQVTLAGAFASYYWASKKPDDMPAFPIFSSLGRALRYHTGSMAFGSLILAIVQVIRVLLEYVDYKLKGAQNRFAKFLLCCLKCCFWCLEKFIKFLNRNAYIMIAIYGKNFCTSARDGFIALTVTAAATRFYFISFHFSGILSFFFFSGKMKGIESTTPALNYYWVPIVTVIIGSYLIAHGFFSVYAMCVDTLFLCFCEDLERNDGSAERPYFMSPELHDILSENAVMEEVKELPDQEEETPWEQDREIQLHQCPEMQENGEENLQKVQHE
uniref:Choline transporter-like protein n=1 Tax=Scleropages formosus TaxID=113540 RepID=A0A8C9UBR5_SCLFO